MADAESGCLNWFIDCLSEVRRYLEDHPTLQVVSQGGYKPLTTGLTQPWGTYLSTTYKSWDDPASRHWVMLQISAKWSNLNLSFSKNLGESNTLKFHRFHSSPPENLPCQKENNLPTIIFQGVSWNSTLGPQLTPNDQGLDLPIHPATVANWRSIRTPYWKGWSPWGLRYRNPYY